MRYAIFDLSKILRVEIAGFGDEVTNAKIYATTITGYVNLFPMSVAVAASVFAGRYKGANEPQKVRAVLNQTLRINLLLTFLISVAVCALQKPLLGLFTSDPQTIAAAKWVFLLDIAVELGRAVNNVMEQGLNSVGDVKFTLISSAVAVWAFNVLALYLLSVVCRLALVGVWIGFALHENVKGALYLHRIHTNKWENRRV